MTFIIIIIIIIIVEFSPASFTRATIRLTSGCDHGTTFSIKMQILLTKLHLIRPFIYFTSSQCLPKSATISLFVHLNILLYTSFSLMLCRFHLLILFSLFLFLDNPSNMCCKSPVPKHNRNLSFSSVLRNPSQLLHSC